MRIVKIFGGAVMATILIALGAIGYNKYNEQYAVSTDDNGLAIARVVAASLYRTSDLRVSRLSGVVQGVGRDVRWIGWLESTKIVKSPFEVSYFVDISKLKPGDFRFDELSNTLYVVAPDLKISRPDVDEASVTLDRTSGVFVTRDAMAQMQRAVALSAQKVAAEEARKPANLAKAKENARGVLASLFSGTLRAARLNAKVQVRFADEPVADDARWDVSRSLEDVLGNRR